MPREIGRRRTDPDKTYEGKERVVKEGGTVSIGEGWASDRQTPVIKRSDKLNRFSVDEGQEVLVHFVEARPFASWWQHWVNKKPKTCIITDCPLCQIDDTPKQTECFNVIEMSDSGPKLLLWQLSADPSKAVKARAESARTKPVNKLEQYFAISKTTGSNGFATYTVDPVKASELKEDWGVEALTQEQFDELAKTAYTKEIAPEGSRHELQALVSSLED
jgi:hypothetical protein